MKHTLQRITLLTDTVVKLVLYQGVLVLLLLHAGMASAQTIVITAVNPNPVCAGAAVTVSYVHSFVGTGTYTLYLYNATGSAVSAKGPTVLNWVPGAYSDNLFIPAGLPTGTYTVGITRVSATNSTYNSPRSAGFTISAVPATPGVTNLAYCQGTTGVPPLTATGQNLKWYTASTGGVGSATAPTPPSSTVVSTNYYVSQTINGCEGPRAMLTVTINPLPNAPTTTNISYCQNATAAPLTASGQNLRWYTAASGGTPSTTVTPSTSTAGSMTYYVTQTDNNSCESARTPLTVTINAAPPAPAVTNTVVSYCQNTTAQPLQATATSGNTLNWYTSQGTALGSTAPTPSTTNPGTSTYQVSQRNTSGCESDRVPITVTINALPVAPATSPASACQGGAPVSLVSSVTATGTLKWYTSPTSASLAAAPQVGTASTGSQVFYVSQTNASGCESSRAAISYTVYARPNPPAVQSPVAYCQNAVAQPLQATASPGGTLNFYTQASGGVPSIELTPSTQASEIYYVSQTVNGCESSTRASITVTINALPPSPAVTTPVTYCQLAPASPLSATVTPNNTLTWYGTDGQPLTGAPTPPTGNTGTFLYSVSQTSAEGCQSERAVITVTVNPVPSAPLVSPTPVVYCQGALASPLTATATAPNGILNWYTQAVGGTPSPVYPTPSTAESEPPTRYYYVSQSINGCEGPRATIAVTIRPAVAVSIVGLPGRLGQCAAPISLVGSPAGGTFTIDGLPATQLIPGNLSAGSHSIVYQYVSAGGCTATATGSVIIDPLPVATLVNSGPLSCTNPVVTLAAGENGFGVSFRFSAGATQLATQSLATVLTAGVYSVTVTAPSGCSAIAQTTVTSETALVAPTLQASAPATDNQPISVTATGCSGAINWLVQGGSGQPAGTIYTVTQPGTYTISARCSAGSCASADATPVIVTIRAGVFAITGVTTQQCQLVDATRGEFLVTFAPQYSGLNGSPVSLAVVNEVAATAAPAPYTVRLFTDNPVVTLAATQAGSPEARYSYSWRAACIGNVSPNRPPVASAIPAQPLQQNQPYQLVLTSYFADPDGQPLRFSASGLPAGIVLTGSQLSGSPTTSGTTSATITATDPNGLQATTAVVFTVSAPDVPVPPTTGFAITGVTNLSCVAVSSSQRRISFSPVYSGLSGQPVRFRVVNESPETTTPGPYTLQLYTDNPTITLEAVQANATATYRYNWLAGCTNQPTTPPTGNRPPTVGTALASQMAQAGQGYTLFIPAGTFTDPDNDQLQLSVSGLPAGLSFSAAQNAITGTPSQAGTSTVQVSATDPGGLSVSTSFVLTVQPAATNPTPGGFSIAGVTGVRCETLSAGERQLSFSPVYTGLTGAPVSFGVTNEIVTTTAPGPYALRLYTDNPAITLTATQGGTPASYRFNWLAACATNPNGRQAVAEAGSLLSVVVLGNPVVGESVEVLIGGVAGQAVDLSLTDLAGNRLHRQQLPQVSGTERVVVPVPAGRAMTILKVSTATQQQTVKMIRQ